MKNDYTHKEIGYFAWLYSVYLKNYYPDAWHRFIQREDHMELLKKYQVFCQDNMATMMELLRKKYGLENRRLLDPGIQVNLYDHLVNMVKNRTFSSLIDLLQETSWMTE